MWLLLYYYIFQWDFAANNLKTHGRNSLGHIHKGNPIHYGESKLPLIVSGPPRDEVLPLLTGILNLFVVVVVSGNRTLPWRSCQFALTRTSLLTAPSHFFSGAFTLLPCHCCALTSPHSPFPASIAGLGASAPMTPLIPLTIG